MISPSFAEKIMYFKDKHNHQIGVKNQSGKIIVSPKYTPMFAYPLGENIRQPFIEFTFSEMHKCNEPNSAVYAGGDVYDKKGNYLHSPLYFDMGMDDWTEGKRRFADGCQVGFVNADNEKIIAAHYGFAMPFFYGYSEVIEGKAERIYAANDREHWSVKAGDFVINEKGEKVSGSFAPQSPEDIKILGKYYPKPFQYNDFEKNILKQVNQLKILNELAIFSSSNDTLPPIQYEIVARPSRYQPFYVLRAFRHYPDFEKKDEDEIELVADKRGKVYVDTGGSHYYHYGYDIKQYQSLKKWLLQELARPTYQKQNPKTTRHYFPLKQRIREIIAKKGGIF